MRHGKLLFRIFAIAAFYASIFLVVIYVFATPKNYQNSLSAFLRYLYYREAQNLSVLAVILFFSGVLLAWHGITLQKKKHDIKQGVISTYSDPFGNQEKMYHAPLRHYYSDSLVAPLNKIQWSEIKSYLAQQKQLPDADASAITQYEQHLASPEITPLEKQIFLLLYQYRDWPADVTGYHGTSLFFHTLRAWCLGVDKAGYGSDTALLAASHDLGKILAYEKVSPSKDSTDNSPSFQRVSIRHSLLSPTVLRRIPAFSDLPLARRHDLLLCLSLQSRVPGAAPEVSSPEHTTVVRQALATDVQSTKTEVQESTQRAENSSSDDSILDLLVQACNDQLLNKITTLNINRSKNAAGNIDGLSWLSGNAVLIDRRKIRSIFRDILDNDTVERLRLSIDTMGNQHPADSTITAALVQGGFITASYYSETSDDFVFNFRSGSTTLRNYYAFLSDRFPKDIIKHWGDWDKTVDLITKKAPRKQG